MRIGKTVRRGRIGRGPVPATLAISVLAVITLHGVFFPPPPGVPFTVQEAVLWQVASPYSLLYFVVPLVLTLDTRDLLHRAAPQEVVRAGSGARWVVFAVRRGLPRQAWVLAAWLAASLALSLGRPYGSGPLSAPAVGSEPLFAMFAETSLSVGALVALQLLVLCAGFAAFRAVLATTLLAAHRAGTVAVVALVVWLTSTLQFVGLPGLAVGPAQVLRPVQALQFVPWYLVWVYPAGLLALAVAGAALVDAVRARRLRTPVAMLRTPGGVLVAVTAVGTLAVLPVVLPVSATPAAVMTSLGYGTSTSGVPSVQWSLFVITGVGFAYVKSLSIEAEVSGRLPYVLVRNGSALVWLRGVARRVGLHAVLYSAFVVALSAAVGWLLVPTDGATGSRLDVDLAGVSLADVLMVGLVVAPLQLLGYTLLLLLVFWWRRSGAWMLALLALLVVVSLPGANPAQLLPVALNSVGLVADGLSPARLVTQVALTDVLLLALLGVVVHRSTTVHHEES